MFQLNPHRVSCESLRLWCLCRGCGYTHTIKGTVLSVLCMKRWQDHPPWGRASLCRCSLTVLLRQETHKRAGRLEEGNRSSVERVSCVYVCVCVGGGGGPPHTHTHTLCTPHSTQSELRYTTHTDTAAHTTNICATHLHVHNHSHTSHRVLGGGGRQSPHWHFIRKTNVWFLKTKSVMKTLKFD